MAIAPSKLGHLVDEHWHADDELIQALRTAELVRTSASDAELSATFERARKEHAALQSSYNSPNERVRVFLEPYLTAKGRRWAVPLESLKIGDDE